MPNNRSTIVLSNRTYDVGKNLVRVVLPAASSLYFGLANIWGLPGAEQVVGTLAVVATFLGVILGISAQGYERSGAAYDGQINVYTPPNGDKLYSLELDMLPEEIEQMKSITFRVSPETRNIEYPSDEAE